VTTYKIISALFKLICLVLSSPLPIFAVNPNTKIKPIKSKIKPLPRSIFQFPGDASDQSLKGSKTAFDISVLAFHILVTSFYISKDVCNVYIKKISYSKSQNKGWRVIILLHNKYCLFRNTHSICQLFLCYSF